MSFKKMLLTRFLAWNIVNNYSTDTHQTLCLNIGSGLGVTIYDDLALGGLGLGVEELGSHLSCCIEFLPMTLKEIL